MRDSNEGKRTFSQAIRGVMVRKRGRIVVYIRKVGTIDTHCVYLMEGKEQTPILDRVQGIGGVGDDQIQDMEAVSEDEHTRCVKLQKGAGERRKAANEPDMGPTDDTGITLEDIVAEEALVTKSVEKPAQDLSMGAKVATEAPAMDIDKMSKRKLVAIIELEDLDVDSKGRVNEIRARIKAARSGLPDPTLQPALAEQE